MSVSANRAKSHLQIPQLDLLNLQFRPFTYIF